MAEGKTFDLLPEHLTLLRAANVRWSGMEWGAPEIDGKRPYGNGNIVGDICDLLEWTHDLDDEAVRTRALDLHRETDMALQIVLATGTFEPGRYVASRYGRDWRPDDGLDRYDPADVEIRRMLREPYPDINNDYSAWLGQ